MAILRLLNETIVILSNMGTYISIKSTVNAFRYGIDPVPEWFDKISTRLMRLMLWLMVIR